MILTNVLITAYCACKLCCGEWHSHTGHQLTASGTRPVAGRTIAAPKSIPFGTRVVINGHTYRVEDRLSDKYPFRWDIYFTKHRDAVKFGKQRHNVRIIIK